MRKFNRRYWPISILVVLLLGIVMAAYLAKRDQTLKSRADKLVAGQSRKQVVDLLGDPVLKMHRSSGKGILLVWVNQFWQVDVYFGPDELVESVERKPSDSAYRRTLGKILKVP